MFSRYLLFEWKRLLRTPKNIVIIVLFVIALFGFWGFNLYQYAMMQDERIEELSAEKQFYVVEIKYYRRLREFPEGDALYQLLNSSYRQVAQQHLAARQAALDPEDETIRRRELAARIRRDEVLLVGFYNWQMVVIEEGEDALHELSLPRRYRILNPEELIANIQKLRYIENSNMELFFSNYEMAGWHFLYRLVTLFGRFAIPVFVVLFTADNFSAERDSGSYKFLLLQPLSRAGVYFAKLTASFLLCFGILVAGLLMLFGINTMRYSVGESGYPMRFAFFRAPLEYRPYDGDAEVFWANLDPGRVMPAGFVGIREYMLWALLFIFLYLLFLIAFTSLVSIFVDNSITALAICLGVIFSSLLLGEYLPSGEFMWNPIEYVNIYSLSTGTMWGYMWYPVIWAFVLGMIGLLSFRKKDIIC